MHLCGLQLLPSSLDGGQLHSLLGSALPCCCLDKRDSGACAFQLGHLLGIATLLAICQLLLNSLQVENGIRIGLEKYQNLSIYISNIIPS